MRDVDAYEANAGLDETLTVVAGSCAEIQNRSAYFAFEEYQELIAELNPTSPPGEVRRVLDSLDGVDKRRSAARRST